MSERITASNEINPFRSNNKDTKRRRKIMTKSTRRHTTNRRFVATSWKLSEWTLVTILVLLCSSFLPSPTTTFESGDCGGGFGNPINKATTTFRTTILPVACAALTRNGGQPTKELDLEDHTEAEADADAQDSVPKQRRMQEVVGEKRMSPSQLFRKAGRKALGGGIPGFLAGIIQVLSLMWVRTIINYQSRYGTTFNVALVTLLKDGGIPRLYRGLSFAIVQAPISRFVSTAANDGVEFLLAGLKLTEAWGPGRTTVVASLVVGCMRIALMPIDTCKTVLQVDSMEGFRSMMRRVKAGKFGVLYQGAFALAASSALAHYPWFYTYNLLSKSEMVKSLISSSLLRNAGIGVVASFISDTFVNSLRVIKTTKQSMASKHVMGYLDTVRYIVAADGWTGLFGRGLRTRLFANALQSLVFTVIWRGLGEHFSRRK